MAKIKAARGGKKKRKANMEAIPCLVAILAAIVLVSLLFYAILQSAS